MKVLPIVQWGHEFGLGILAVAYRTPANLDGYRRVIHLASCLGPLSFALFVWWGRASKKEDAGT